MHVQMWYAFTCVGSAVDHDSIAGGQLQLFCHITRNQKEFAEQCGVLICCIRETLNSFFRHDQHMHWRLGIDVVKRNRVLIFPNDFGGNLARDDFFENRHES